MDIDHIVATLHRDVVARQWAVLEPYVQDELEGFEDRMSQCMEEGIRTLATFAEVAGVDAETLQSLTERDSRFEFLFSLPRTAGIGGRIGDVLNIALYGESSAQSKLLGQWVYVFIRCLDGVIDNAPELLDDDAKTALREEIFAGLGQSDWIPPAPETDGQRHPAIKLLHAAALSWVAAVRDSDGWQGDSRVQEAISIAAAAALDAEYRTPFSVFDRAVTDMAVLSDAIDEKTRTATWCIALMPVCVNGLGPEIDLDRYRACMAAWGNFLEWIDDIQDLVEDSRAGVWNVPLTMLAADGKVAKDAAAFDPALFLGESLMHCPADAFESVGRQRMEAVLAALLQEELACRPVKCLLADLTAASLRPPG